MRKLVLFTCFLTLGIIIWAQTWEGEAYKGTFSSQETVYQVRNNYGKESSRITSREIVKFTPAGLMANRMISDANQTFLGKVLYITKSNPISRDITYYDNVNRVTKREYWIYDSDSLHYTYFRYGFNSLLNQKIVSYQDSLTHKLKLDIYNELGYVVKQHQIAKNNAGQDTLREIFDYDGFLYSRIHYRYNDKNQLIEARCIAWTDTLLNSEVYRYDDNGNVLEYKEINNKENTATRTNYLYDQHNRIIEVRKYVASDAFGGLEILTERKVIRYTDEDPKAKQHRNKKK